MISTKGGDIHPSPRAPVGAKKFLEGWCRWVAHKILLLDPVSIGPLGLGLIWSWKWDLGLWGLGLGLGLDNNTLSLDN